MHYLIKKTQLQNERFILFAEDQLNEIKDPKIEQKDESKTKKKINLESQQKEYVQKNIIDFYIIYLLKYMMHSKTYVTAK